MTEKSYAMQLQGQECSTVLRLSPTQMHTHNGKIKSSGVARPDLGRWFFRQTAGAAVPFAASHWDRRYKSLDFSGNSPHGTTGMEPQKFRGRLSNSH